MDTIKTSDGAISRDDYITRAAAAFQTHGGLDADTAREQATILADQRDEGGMWEGFEPEDAALEEMSYWDDDGEEGGAA